MHHIGIFVGGLKKNKKSIIRIVGKQPKFEPDTFLNTFTEDKAVSTTAC